MGFWRNFFKKFILVVILVFVFILILDNLPVKSFKELKNSPTPNSSTSQIFKVIDSEQLIRSKTGLEKIEPAPETKFYQIPFSRTTEKGLVYKDALVFSPQEYDQLTLDQINQMEDERFDNWLSLIDSKSKAATIYKPNK